MQLLERDRTFPFLSEKKRKDCILTVYLLTMVSGCRIFLIVLACIVAPYLGAQSLFFSNLSSRDGLPSNVITAIVQDAHQFIWVGTANGLARYDGYTFKVFKRAEENNSLPSNGITSLVSDGEFIWVGTWSGLCKINTKT